MPKIRHISPIPSFCGNVKAASSCQSSIKRSIRSPFRSPRRPVWAAESWDFAIGRSHRISRRNRSQLLRQYSISSNIRIKEKPIHAPVHESPGPDRGTIISQPGSLSRGPGWIFCSSGVYFSVQAELRSLVKRACIFVQAELRIFVQASLYFSFKTGCFVHSTLPRRATCPPMPPPARRRPPPQRIRGQVLVVFVSDDTAINPFAGQ